VIRVQFLKVWRMYQPGEFAGFEPDLATQIVAGGFAVAVEDSKAEPKVDAKAAAAAAKARAKADAEAAEAEAKAKADAEAAEAEAKAKGK